MTEFEKPLFIVFTGLMGTGKTTFAQELAQKFSNYFRVSTDDTRRILGKNRFDPQDTPQVNEHVFLTMRLILDQDKGVIVDSANKTKMARDKLYSIARECSVPIVVIECVCSSKTAIKRITSRPSRDGLHKPTNNAEDYQKYLKLWENIDIDIIDEKNKDISFFRLNTDTNMLQLLKKSLRNSINETSFIEALHKLIEERKRQ
ncbi:MAG: ATP-binding protein [Nanoarchaeota archaeon]